MGKGVPPNSAANSTVWSKRRDILMSVCHFVSLLETTTVGLELSGNFSSPLVAVPVPSVPCMMSGYGILMEN